MVFLFLRGAQYSQLVPGRVIYPATALGSSTLPKSMPLYAIIYLVLGLLLLCNVVGLVAPRLYGSQLALLGSVTFIVVMLTMPQLVLLGLLLTSVLLLVGELFTWPGLLGLLVHVIAWGLMIAHVWQQRTCPILLDGKVWHPTDPLFGEPAPAAPPFAYLPLLTRKTRARARVRRHPSVVYREIDGVKLRLDVYTASGAVDSSRLPALVYIHGGGWVAGTRRQSPFLMFELAASGYVVFSIDYRLAPKHPLPAAIVDCKAAIAWVKAHAAAYGAGPEVLVMGGSAGAHLAAMVAYSPMVQAFQPGFETADTSVRGAVLLYGLYDIVGKVSRHPGSMLARYFEDGVFSARYAESPERFAEAQPLTHCSASSPPTLLLHGQRDSLVPIEDSRKLYRALRAAGVRAHLCELSIAQHAYELAPLPLFQRTTPIVLSFLRQIHS